MLCLYGDFELLWQAGVGLMALQQFGGVNGIGFYVKSLFTTAGMQKFKPERIPFVNRLVFSF